MNRILIKCIPVSFFAFLLGTFDALGGAADEIGRGLTAVNKTAGYATDTLPDVVGKVIQALLGVVGVIFLVLTVYAGILYMTDAGSGDRVKKAKSILTTSVTGLVIVIAAYAFTSFVVTELSKATNPAPPANG